MLFSEATALAVEAAIKAREARETRTYAAIARDIRAAWPRVYFGAEPYLEALETMNTTDRDASYGLDSAREIVVYALANMAAFRGEKAQALKAELRGLVGLDAPKPRKARRPPRY